jgi:NitT/TauT family transport system permease protein
MSEAVKRHGANLLPWVGLAIAGSAWWIVAAERWRNDPVLSAFGPVPSLEALAGFVGSGELWPHLWASLGRVLYGVGLAAVVGIPLGVVLGIWRPLERTTSALFQFLRMVSPISWMPLAVMAFGLGDLPVIFLISAASIWPIVLNTIAGVSAVDPRRLLLARSLCATRAETVLKIVVPSILGHVLTGLRLAVGVAWIVLVPAEMLGVRAGLGYYILDTRDRLAYSELVAVVLVIGLVGLVLDSLLRAAHRLWAGPA